jgi:outer membrane lipoprotein-sorting protein
MMTMKSIKIISFLLLATLSIKAQQQNAEPILKSLAEKHNSYDNLTADFTFHFKSLQSDQQKEWSGTIIMAGEKYKLELRNSTMYYNGETLWNHLHGPNEVNISEPPKDENADIINHPYKIFDIYNKDFKYQYIEQRTTGNQELHVIDLYPKDLDKDYSRVRLFLTSGDVQLHAAKIFAKDGSRYRIEINNLKTNQSVPDSTFVFDEKAHPDAEIIDMRF